MITITLVREAADDIKRFLRDKELNSQLYKIMTLEGIKMVPSSSLKVGDVIIIEKVSLFDTCIRNKIQNILEPTCSR